MAHSSYIDDGGQGRRGPHPLALAYVSLLGLVVVLGVGIALFGDPRVGDPVARLALGPTRPTAWHPTASVSPAAKAPSAAGPGVPVTEVPPALVPATVAKPVFAGRTLIADPALIEQTRFGPLPRIADDGRMPMVAYAAPVPVAPGRPRIAIVITGLGISARATNAALAGLPAQVTLAFAPYSEDAQRWVGEARKQGHEVLLELPMEPYDFPDSDPGPHTLRAGLAEETNTERLVWALTRFTGYAGVTNLLGGRFLADPDSLAPVMTYLTRRGLLFYDNGSATHSAAPDVAARVGTAFAQSSATIDSIQTAMEIDRRLSDLETAARAHGSAAGSGFLYPSTIQRVSLWAQGLGERGFVLVPASAVVSPPKAQ